MSCDYHVTKMATSVGGDELAEDWWETKRTNRKRAKDTSRTRFTGVEVEVKSPLPKRSVKSATLDGDAEVRMATRNGSLSRE